MAMFTVPDLSYNRVAVVMMTIEDGGDHRRREPADLGCETMQHSKRHDCNFEVDPLWYTQRSQ